MSEVDLSGTRGWPSHLLRKCNMKFEVSSMLKSSIAGTIGWSKGNGSEEPAPFMQKRRWAM